MTCICICQGTKTLWPRHESTHADGQTEYMTHHAQGHTEVMNICETSSHSDTLCARYGMRTSKKKEVMAWTRICRHESKHADGQTDRQTNTVHDTSSHGDASMCQIQDAHGKEQRSMARTRIYVKKLIILTLRSKVKVITEVMNLHHTLSHSNTLMYQICLPQGTKKLRPGHEATQTDRVILIYPTPPPPNFLGGGGGGYNK